MKNIVLLGFMGSGKSSVGRILSKRLQRPFIDTDHKIEKDHGKKIPEIFAECGEEGFRNIEQQTIEEVSRMEGAIISTGGGSVLRKANVDALRKNGILITLTASPEVIIERVSRKKNRPLLNRPDRDEFIHKLMEERKPFYSVADLVLDTSGNELHDVTRRIIGYLLRRGELK